MAKVSPLGAAGHAVDQPPLKVLSHRGLQRTAAGPRHDHPPALPGRNRFEHRLGINLDAINALRRDTGVAVLWTTHLVDEVADADRVVVLHQGQVRFDGSTTEFMAAAEGGDFQAEVLRQLGRHGD